MFHYLESDQKYAKQIAEESVPNSEVLLIQHKKYTTQKVQHKKYNTYVQRKVGLISSELSMMGNGPKQKYVDNRPIPFQNDDPENAQLENTGKSLDALHPISAINSV